MNITAAYPFNLTIPQGSKTPITMLDHIDAIKRVFSGNGSAHDAKVFYDWVVIEAAGWVSQSFNAGNADVTAFNEGRRFVAMAIHEIVNAPQHKIDAMKKTIEEGKQ